MRNSKLLGAGIVGGLMFSCCGGICLYSVVLRAVGVEPRPIPPRVKPPAVEKAEPAKELPVSSEKPAEPTKPKEPSERELYGSESVVAGIAKDAVRSQLKVPSTAKFPRQGFKARRDEQGRWVVTGFVDAQNAFGAMLRQHYTVTIQYQRDREQDEYDLESYELVDCVLWE